MDRETRDRGRRFRDGLLQWAEYNVREFPWRDPSASRYEVFVAEFFLTQTPAENVAAVYPEFVDDFPGLSAIERAERDDLVRAIEPLGFQRMRAEALKEIATEHDELPGTADELRELPRVGRYVANATLCFAEERALPIVDRNVVRVYSRIFEAAFPDADRERWEFARRILPENGKEACTYNLALLDFATAVCAKRDPRCESCFAAPFCRFVGGQREPTG